jgi:hypothetical protein
MILIHSTYCDSDWITILYLRVAGSLYSLAIQKENETTLMYLFRLCFAGETCLLHLNYGYSSE